MLPFRPWDTNAQEDYPTTKRRRKMTRRLPFSSYTQFIYIPYQCNSEYTKQQYTIHKTINKILIISLCEKNCKQLRERFLKQNTVLRRDTKKEMKRVTVVQHNALLHLYFTMTFNLIDNYFEDPTVTHQSQVGMSCRSAFRWTSAACFIPFLAFLILFFFQNFFSYLFTILAISMRFIVCNVTTKSQISCQLVLLHCLLNKNSLITKTDIPQFENTLLPKIFTCRFSWQENLVQICELSLPIHSRKHFEHLFRIYTTLYHLAP